MKYLMTLKGGAQWTLADNGRIEWDGTRKQGAFSDDWRIIGFTRRHHSARIISLAAAAGGEDIGQGWVHDIDHGTHRMWCMPKSQRAVKVINTS